MIPTFCLYYTVIFLTAPFRKVAGCLGKFHNIHVGANIVRPRSLAAADTLHGRIWNPPLREVAVAKFLRASNARPYSAAAKVTLLLSLFVP